MGQFITQEDISEIFTMDEVASMTTPEDVESYGIKDGMVYIRRFFNNYGGKVPPMDAYLVAVFHDGTREEIRTNDPAEITLWTKHLR
jgi:hypothetical protein